MLRCLIVALCISAVSGCIRRFGAVTIPEDTRCASGEQTACVCASGRTGLSVCNEERESTACDCSAVSIFPASATVSVGGEVAFTAQLIDADGALASFAVLETGGGVIDASGGYVAPIAPGVYRVSAQIAGGKSAIATVTVVPAPVQPAISFASAFVTEGRPGYVAAIADAVAGLSYHWSIGNGIITSAASGTNVTFTAGAPGPVVVTCVATNTLGESSAPAVLSLSSIELPRAPIVVAPPAVTALRAGYVVRVEASDLGVGYAWTASGGTLAATTGQSTTFTAGPSGVVHLAVRAVNAAGDASDETVVDVPIRPSGIAVVAGALGGRGFSDGSGADVRFAAPYGVAVDSLGRAYVADSDNHVIRRVNTDGSVALVAGIVGIAGPQQGSLSTARFTSPKWIALADDDTLLVTDAANNCLRRVTLGPGPVTVTNLTACNRLSCTTGNGPFASTRLCEPGAIVAASPTEVYVAAKGGGASVHRVDTTGPGSIMLVAGSTGSIGDVPNGTGGPTGVSGVDARFGVIGAMAQDPSDQSLVIAMNSNQLRRIGSDPDAFVTLQLAKEVGNEISGLAFAPDGTLLGTNACPSGCLVDPRIVGVVALTGDGVALAGGDENGAIDGAAMSARYSGPAGLAFGPSGQLFVADRDNHTLRLLTGFDTAGTMEGTVTSVGASLPHPGATDGAGGAARFFGPRGIVGVGGDTFYLADTENHRIRRIDRASDQPTVATVAGAGVGFRNGSLPLARFSRPQGIARRGDGALVVADTGNHAIRVLDTTGVVSTLAGNGSDGVQDGDGTAATFRDPRGVAVDPLSGMIFVADTGNNMLRGVLPTREVISIAGCPIAGTADGAMTAACQPFALNCGCATFDAPSAIAIESIDRVYVYDAGSARLRAVETELTGGGGQTVVRTVVVGSAGPPRDGPCDCTAFPSPACGSLSMRSEPAGLAVFEGAVYVTEGFRLRRVTHPNDALCAIETLAGSGTVRRVTPGPLPGFLNGGMAIAIDFFGTIFLADAFENSVLEVRLP
ncbi:MAG: hypothetical protein IT381_30080 [Deltaproteobacteria bacterium]|nr:hypothetical protein [Deltaproteobacteria bacterium]